tara:strand:+ start:291 stop:611 length:321 start_codon:yes stop_codon:yes gene_type:complete
MIRPKMRPKVSMLDDIKTDFGYFKAAITGEAYNDPNPARTRSRAARSKAAMLDLNKSDKSSKPKGPTAAQKSAAKMAARKEKGRVRRKKYEAAMTQRKKMKLLFND